MSLSCQMLSVESLALSPAEKRAYPRWYTDLLVRKRSETVAVVDTYRFVDNFGVSDADKEKIAYMLDANLASLEPAQFYAFLRLIGHLLQGKEPRRDLAFVSAPVPKPRSILSVQKRKTEQSNPFRKSGFKRKKKVTFDNAPPQVAEAAQRSMHELLQQQHLLYSPAPSPAPPEQPMQIEVEPEVNAQFEHVNIDSVLYHGVSHVPQPPPPRKLTPNLTGPASLQPSSMPMGGRKLTPNLTGPAELSRMGVLGPGESMSAVPDLSSFAAQFRPENPNYLRYPCTTPELLSQFANQFHPPQPSGDQFLNSVSQARGDQFLSSVSKQDRHRVAPPPSYTQRNPYDTMNMTSQLNGIEREWTA